MRFLFIHQNFPGQFKHLAQALVAGGHEVLALGINKPVAPVDGVRYLMYCPAPLPAADSAHPMARIAGDWHVKIGRGEAAARAMRELRRNGFEPDVVAAHPGWGEALFIKDVFPHARLIVYAEFFYGGTGGDTGFDRNSARSR